MRKALSTLIIVVILGGIALVADRGARQASYKASGGDSYGTTTLSIEGSPLILEIADTPEKRSLGLGSRKSLPQGTGMLFVFERAGVHGFWMKDMEFPIDIAWLDEDFCILTGTERVAPDTYPTIFVPESPARYVIEVPSGFLGSHNLSKHGCFDKLAF
jgi:uncharacterized protein